MYLTQELFVEPWDAPNAAKSGDLIVERHWLSRRVEGVLFTELLRSRRTSNKGNEFLLSSSIDVEGRRFVTSVGRNIFREGKRKSPRGFGGLVWGECLV